jgi:ADP-heptose:LPS heptosyltransferase
MPKILSFIDMKIIKNDYFIIILTEHIGDIIACEPIISYLKKINPTKRISWVINRVYYELLIAHPQLDYLIIIDTLDDVNYILNNINDKNNIINLHLDGKICRQTGVTLKNRNKVNINQFNYLYYGNLLEIFSQIAGLPKLSYQPTFHILSFLNLPNYLPENYIVIHCKSNDKRKDWPSFKWTELTKKIILRGINVVEVGTEAKAQPNDKYNYGYYNLTNINHLQLIALIIKKANFFIGIDSGLAHIANALLVNGFAIIGRYGKFTKYNPFPGFYSTPGHLVRSSFCQKVSSISVNKIFRYFTKYYIK